MSRNYFLLLIIFILFAGPAFGEISFKPDHSQALEWAPGDIDHDKLINISDVILVLKILTGTDPDDGSADYPDRDINKDEKIGTEEALYVLQIIAGIINYAPYKPVLSFPENGQTTDALTLTLETDVFSDPNSGDPHIQTWWQVDKNSDFTLPVIDEKTSEHLTSLSLSDRDLNAETIYYWRVRFYDSQNSESEWSDAFSFKTRNHPPDKPVLFLPEDGQDFDLLQNPMLQSKEFSDPDSGDTHAHTYWQVAEDTEFSSPVMDEKLTEHLTSFPLTDVALQAGKKYYWKIKFYDNHNAESEWSATFSFKTKNHPPEKPVISFPEDGKDVDLQKNPVLRINKFSDQDAGDYHTRTQWQISTDNNFTSVITDETNDMHLVSLPLPDTVLQADTMYYWRVRFYDNHNATSEWSDSFWFKIINHQPDKPVLSSPANGQTVDLLLNPSLQTNDFSDPDNSDTHSNTLWQISKGPDFMAFVFNEKLTGQLTSLSIPSSVSEADTIYYWRVRFYDNHNAESEWADASWFKTKNHPPDKPVLSSPANLKEIDLLVSSLILQTKNFSDPDKNDTHTASEWQVSENNDFSLLVLYETKADHLIALTVSESVLEAGTTYYWKVRFHDSHNGKSEWSDVFSFKIMNHPPDKPLLYSPANGQEIDLLSNPNLITEAFTDKDKGDTHAQTQWQVSKSYSFSSKVIDKTDSSDLTSLLLSPYELQTGMTYYWRVRFHDNHNRTSEWSDVFSFNTENHFPDQPLLISPSYGQTDISLTPELQTGSFSDQDTNDTHTKTRWQISTSPDFMTSVLDETSTTNLIKYKIASSVLSTETIYHWRVRFYDSHNGESDWSESSWFKTYAESGLLVFTFDFAGGLENWTGGFSDYPVADEEYYELDWKRSPLPDELQPSPPSSQKHSIFITGINHSDDLFMFIKRQLTSLKPNTKYALTFTIQLATSAPKGCVGVGGAPGEDVWVKAGASTLEPEPYVSGFGYLMNIDKGNQSNGGKDAIGIGNVANSITDCSSEKYEIKELTNSSSPFEITSDSNGSIWVIIGTDSGFESKTSLYYSNIEIHALQRDK